MSIATGNTKKGVAFEKNPLLARWNSVLERFREEPAILAPDRGVLRSFSDIEAEAGDAAREFEPFPSGSVVALQLGNDAVWPAALLACFRLGLVPLPLGRHLGEAEREAALEVCGAAALAEFKGGRLAISARNGRPPAGRTVEFMKLTSGTTAAPRAICFRAAQLVADCDNICETMGI